MRSLLFVPADSERKLARGTEFGADALILDLEDAVSAPRKAVAREMAAHYIRDLRPRPQRPRLYVRINALDTSLWQDDLAGVIGAGPDGVMLPKPRSGGDVHTLSIALNHAEERAGASVGSTRVIALATEVPAALLNIASFIGASSRLEGLTWGAEDLSAVVGSRANREADGRAWTSPYRLARDMTLFTAVAAEVQPIDTVFVNFRDAEGLREEARLAARDGFTGKMAIHPGQVADINAMFTPVAEEVARAEALVALFAAIPTPARWPSKAAWSTGRTWCAPSGCWRGRSREGRRMSTAYASRRLWCRPPRTAEYGLSPIPPYGVSLRGLHLQFRYRLLGARTLDGEHRLRCHDGVVHVAEAGDGTHGAGVDPAVFDEAVIDVDPDHLADDDGIARLAAGPGGRSMVFQCLHSKRGGALLDARRLDHPAGSGGEVADRKFIDAAGHRGRRHVHVEAQIPGGERAHELAGFLDVEQRVLGRPS